MTADPTSSQFPRTRQLIWIYFWLLILEGVLRKWVVPSLSNPLLIVRDPVALAIYFSAAREGGFPRTGFIAAIIGIAGFFLIASMLVIPEHPLVTAYGLRADFLHLPLVFVLARVLTHKDVQRIGYAVLICGLPMAALVYRQFESPGDSWINKGAGEGSVQIESAYDRIRPAGTFSYSNGLLAYISLLASFLFYGFFKARTYPNWLLYGCVFSLFLMVTFSGSRSVLSSVSILVIAAMAISITRPNLIGGSVKALFAVAIVYMALGSATVIRQGFDVLNYRYEGGGGLRAGIIDRYLDTLLPFNAVQTAPFLGFGLGVGTNAGAGLITGGRGFLLAENEWERIIMESGVLLGLAYICLRVSIMLHAGRAAILQLHDGDTLSIFLFAGFALQMLNGQFAQPSALGFGVFGLGLSLAAAKLGRSTDSAGPLFVDGRPLRNAPVRSRALHAQAPS